MISDYMRKLIEPNLLIYIRDEDYKYLDYMFEECYLTIEEGREKVTVRPAPGSGKLALQFSVLNGACNGLVLWEEIVSQGKRI